MLMQKETNNLKIEHAHRYFLVLRAFCKANPRLDTCSTSSSTSCYTSYFKLYRRIFMWSWLSLCVRTSTKWTNNVCVAVWMTYTREVCAICENAWIVLILTSPPAKFGLEKHQVVAVANWGSHKSHKNIVRYSTLSLQLMAEEKKNWTRRRIWCLLCISCS